MRSPRDPNTDSLEADERSVASPVPARARELKPTARGSNTHVHTSAPRARRPTTAPPATRLPTPLEQSIAEALETLDLAFDTILTSPPALGIETVGPVALPTPPAPVEPPAYEQLELQGAAAVLEDSVIYDGGPSAAFDELEGLEDFEEIEDVEAVDDFEAVEEQAADVDIEIDVDVEAPVPLANIDLSGLLPTPPEDFDAILTTERAVVPIARPTLPELSVPDLSVPDLSVPDLSVPDLSVPDLSVPDTSMPVLSMPEPSVPDADAERDAPDWEATEPRRRGRGVLIVALPFVAAIAIAVSIGQLVAAYGSDERAPVAPASPEETMINAVATALARPAATQAPTFTDEAPPPPRSTPSPSTPALAEQPSDTEIEIHKAPVVDHASKRAEPRVALTKVDRVHRAKSTRARRPVGTARTATASPAATTKPHAQPAPKPSTPAAPSQLTAKPEDLDSPFPQ